MDSAVDGGAPQCAFMLACAHRELLRRSCRCCLPLDWRDGDQVCSARIRRAAISGDFVARQRAGNQRGVSLPVRACMDQRIGRVMRQLVSRRRFIVRCLDAAGGCGNPAPARGDMRRLAGESAELTPSISWDSKTDRVCQPTKGGIAGLLRVREAASGEERALLENSFRFSTAHFRRCSRVVYSGANGDLLSSDQAAESPENAVRALRNSRGSLQQKLRNCFFEPPKMRPHDVRHAA